MTAPAMVWLHDDSPRPRNGSAPLKVPPIPGMVQPNQVSPAQPSVTSMIAPSSPRYGSGHHRPATVQSHNAFPPHPPWFSPPTSFQPWFNPTMAPATPAWFGPTPPPSAPMWFSPCYPLRSPLTPPSITALPVLPPPPIIVHPHAPQPCSPPRSARRVVRPAAPHSRDRALRRAPPPR